jgi:alpha-amylase/alpha-mannosidase (GH57 family)
VITNVFTTVPVDERPGVRIAYRVSFLFALICCLSMCAAQPTAVPQGVRFTFWNAIAHTIAVVGDFNGWSATQDPLARGEHDVWSVVRKIPPGIYQYKFLLDGKHYQVDPDNPVLVDNYDRSAKNSVFVVTEEGKVVLSAQPPEPARNPRDAYAPAPGKKPVYLNIVWHQHQPSYANPEADQLTGPWVRTHATKDYYDMAAMLRAYPDVHCTINLTSSLLLQLREYYVKRMGPFIDTRKNRFDVKGFLSKWKGKTDPWIDLALKPAEQFTDVDRGYLYRNGWNALGISDVMLARFPEYKALRDRVTRESVGSENLFSVQEMREIKFWFYLAHFDPDFLHGAVTLPDGSVCDLSSYVASRSDGTWYLRRKVDEADCRRIVLEAYKVIASVIPVHRSLRYSPQRHTGQIDVITTPYYHPILPLIYDSDLARICQPADALPSPYAYPMDAEAQVAKAVKMYTEIFGTPPNGMWPGEGSVAQPVLEVLRRNGILWTASDVRVLQRSRPANQPNTTPYRFPAGSNPISLVFRDTDLSDRIGFKYQTLDGEAAAEDFVQSILTHAPDSSQADVLVTVILDGENAWEWYTKSQDGKEFLQAFYRKLSALYKMKRVITATMSEYLSGNPLRSVAPHPVDTQPGMEWLWPGSWINANYDTWIGEVEENRAWEYLLKTRQDLARSGVNRPDPKSTTPRQNTRAWYAYMAWEEMYAAEGSDWFWWFGADQIAPGGDTPFDVGFRIHLRNVYKFLKLAGAKTDSPVFPPVIIAGAAQGGVEAGSASGGGKGAMARASGDTVTVLFTCDARARRVSAAIYICGDQPELGSWVPNSVPMHDDGRNGDELAGDGIWSLTVDLPGVKEIHYKYTNSGTRGSWIPGEEFPARDRVRQIEKADNPIIFRDTFGQ